MKLKKIISLVLVFAMMVTVFSAVAVSAEGTATANLEFVAYDNDGNPVAGNLEAGKTYQIGIKLTDISEKKFQSAQVAVHYNSDTIEIVDKNGDPATKAKDVFIDRADIYNADEEEGYYAKVAAKIDAANALLIYALGMDKDAGVTSVDNDGEFEVVKFRIKAKKDGQTGISIATSALGEGKYDASNPDGIIVTTPSDATVTIVPVAFRIGEVAYTSAVVDSEAVFDKKVGFGVAADSVIETLLKKVKVTYTDEDGAPVDLDSAITWTAPANYNPDKAGSYTFTGSVEVPETINYKGTAISVSAVVTIDKLKVAADAEISVKAKAGEAPVLPATVEVALDDDSKAELSVTWAEVADTSAGNRDVEGTLSGTENIDVNGKKAIAHVTFAPAITEGSFKTVITDSSAAIPVDAEDYDVAIDAVLPDVIFGTNTADEEVFKAVDSWVKVSADPEGGEYKLGDVITFKPVTEGFDFGEFVIAITLEAPEGKKSVTFDKTTVELAYKTDAGITAEKVIEAVEFKGTYADGTEVTVKGADIDWNADDVAGFDGANNGVYTLAGTWEDIYGNSQDFDVTVTVTSAGATKITIKSSLLGTNSITSLSMYTLSTQKVYVALEPVGVVDTVKWTVSNSAYATVTGNADGSATIKTKSVSGKVVVTATTGSGLKASFTLVINDSNSGAVQIGSSSGNGKGGFSLLPSAADDIAAEEVIKSSPFTDLEGYNWAATQIETIRLLGIVSGKTATTFAPADSVTRAEFLAMLVRLFGFKAGADVKTFTDVSADDWFYDAVNAASSLGIAYGYENGAFDPNAVITREDMAVFAKRALEAAGVDPDKGITGVFSDDGDISDYAHDAVMYMSAIGAINGMGDGTFAPRATANRAQAAVIIYNLYIKK